MKIIILVDGYNVIHSSSRLNKLLKRSKHQAQEELVSLVSAYCSFQEIEGCIVFDAYRWHCLNSEERISSRVKVILTGRGQTADSYIERFVALSKANYDYIYVVTSDNSQRRVVDSEGVVFLPPQSFLKEIESCQKTLVENYLSSPSKSPIRISDCLKNEAREKLEIIRNKLS